jgi:Icc-related predicted phosphoesterase
VLLGGFKLAAVSDIHSPRHLAEFKKLLGDTRIQDARILILAGDLVHNNAHGEIARLLREIKSKYAGRILATFGNNEFEGHEAEYARHDGIEWLLDDSVTIEEKGEPVTFVGSKGVRDRITPWLVVGLTPNPDLEGTKRLYEERLVRLEKLLGSSDNVVVFTHFAPTFDTLLGEDPSGYEELGSLRMQALMKKYAPSVWIHGHSHLSQVHMAHIGATRVYNVALPATHSITFIDI